MFGHIIDDRIARTGDLLNPLTPIRQRWSQYRPYPFDPSYQRWIDSHEHLEFAPVLTDQRNPLGDGPLFTIVVPMFNTPGRFLRELIASVRAQTFGNFEVILADASTDRWSRVLIERSTRGDHRLRYLPLAENKGISANTNHAIERATGTFVVFVDHDDTLAPQALNEVAVHLREHPETDIVYSDEDKLTENGLWRHSPHIKPDWAPHQFLTCNYTCHLSVVRRDLLAQTSGLDPSLDGAQDYEIIFRLHALPGRRVVGHVPKVLYHWREAPGSTSGGAGVKSYAHEAGRRGLQTSLRARGHAVTVPPAERATCVYAPAFRVSPQTRATVLRVVDRNGSDEHLDGLASATDTTDFADVRWITTSEDQLTDHLRACAPGEVVAVVRVAAEPDTARWLADLAGLAQLDDVARVGPRLLDRSGRVHDMGLVRDGSGHLQPLFAGMDALDWTPFGSSLWGRNVTELAGEVVVATAASLDATESADRRHVVWPGVTMTVCGAA